MKTVPRQSFTDSNALTAIFDIYGNQLEALTADQRIDTAIALTMSRRWSWAEVLFLRFKDHRIPSELLAHLMELNDHDKLTLGGLLQYIDRTNGKPAIVPS
jgi:hypothetical protein